MIFSRALRCRPARIEGSTSVRNSLIRPPQPSPERPLIRAVAREDSLWKWPPMQREIELLMLAMQQRHQREAALLERVMSSIAKGNEAHNEMVAGISAALAEHETSTERDRNLRHELEGEI